MASIFRHKDTFIRQNWDQQEIGNDYYNHFNDLNFGINKYILLSTRTSYSSENGDVWNESSTTPTDLIRIIYDNGKFIGVGYSGAIRTSADGLNWE